MSWMGFSGGGRNGGRVCGRLIDSGHGFDSYMNMAVDEALLSSVGRSGVPVLRFYSWRSFAVGVGFFQCVRDEVDVDACVRDGVEVFRRMTGGGAVFKDPRGEINYSFVAPEAMLSHDVLESYRDVGQAVVLGLERLGVHAELSGINDICVSGRKVSGNAQTRRAGAVLQHGTVLVDFDVERMVRYLRIPAVKYSDKGVESVRSRVGSLAELGACSRFRGVMEALRFGFSRFFSVDFSGSGLTADEIDGARELAASKYSAEEWIYWR